MCGVEIKDLAESARAELMHLNKCMDKMEVPLEGTSEYVAYKKLLYHYRGKKSGVCRKFYLDCRSIILGDLFRDRDVTAYYVNVVCKEIFNMKMNQQTLFEKFGGRYNTGGERMEHTAASLLSRSEIELAKQRFRDARNLLSSCREVRHSRKGDV